VSHLGHIDHRKLVVVDGRIGWVGGAGVEDHFDDGRFHDLFVRLTGPVISQLQLVFLATFRWLGGAIGPQELDALLPTHADAPGSVPATVLHNAPGATGRSRPPSPRRSTAPARRSTWSTPTSRTGA
jgi:cardiolipin synthase